MILEHAILNVRTGKSREFEAAMEKARPLIEATPGYQRMEIRPCVETSEGDAAHVALWDFVLEQVGRVSGPKKAPEAAIALWALMHGFIGLANAGVFERDKPRNGFDWGLRAWFRAARG